MPQVFGKENSSEKMDKIFEAAMLRIEKGWDEEAIAATLNIGQPQVSRLLKEAKKQGIIKEVLITPMEVNLSNEIKKRFKHIKDCQVINYSGDITAESGSLLLNELGKQGAAQFRHNVQSNYSIAISCGTTLGKMVECIEKTDTIRNLTVYSLSIWCRPETLAYSPSSLVSDIVNKFEGSTGYNFQLPKFDSLDERNAIEKKINAKLEEALEKAKVIFLGLGSVEKSGLYAKSTLEFCGLVEELKLNENLLNRIAGESCFWPFDINGHILSIRDDDVDKGLERLSFNIFHADLTMLQRIVEEDRAMVYAIAGSRKKHVSILGGLRARIFNCLITDAGSAKYVIENEPLPK